MNQTPIETARRTGRCSRGRPTALASYVLGLGDDALILAQRLAEWITRAPQIEEDMALAQHRARPARPGPHAAHLRRRGARDGHREPRDEDDLAFLRDEREFRNVQLVEIPNGDFAVTMARQLIFSAYQYELYTRAAGLRRRHPGRAGRQGGQGGRLPPGSRHPVGAAARRRHRRSRTTGCRPGWTGSGPTSRKSSTPPTSSPCSPRCRASPSTRPRSGRPGPATSTTSSPRRH